MKRLLVAIHWTTFFWAATFYMWMGFYRIGDSALQVFMTGLVPHVIAIAVWRVMERKVVLFPETRRKSRGVHYGETNLIRSSTITLLL